MTLLAILGIIDKSLELALIFARDLTPEARAGFWTRHEERMAFWTSLAARFQDDGKPRTP